MRVIVNCEIVNVIFFKDPPLMRQMMRVCLLGSIVPVIFQHLKIRDPYQAKDLLIAAGFVLCFLWVYDFSNAMCVPQLSALVSAYQMM